VINHSGDPGIYHHPDESDGSRPVVKMLVTRKGSTMSIVTEEKKGPTQNVETLPSGPFARRPLSVLGKTALWVSVLRFLGGLSALIAFAVAKGTPAPDVYFFTAFSLVIIVLLATRIRWAPLVAIPLAAYILYITFTQPFLLFDLANPKGPNGGFPLFIADVIALGSTIIVLGCCIGYAVENYTQRNKRVPRWYIVGMSMVIGMIIGGIFVGAMAEPSTVTAANYTNGVPTVHMGAGGFVQPTVTISKGSKLVLVDDSTVVHVLFNGSWQNGTPQVMQEPGAPKVSGVQLSGNSVTVGPFTTAGTYHIFCTIHRGMNLTIIVQ
jgi:plastocyanin